MSQTRREIEKLMRQDDWKEALDINRFVNSSDSIINSNVEDLRPLRDRLREQQELKAQKLKDDFRKIITIDEEDAEHLRNVSEMRERMENKIKQEDYIAIEEFRRKSEKLREEEMKKKNHQSLFTIQKLKSKDSNFVNKQKSLLLSGIKRKSVKNELEAKQSKDLQAEKGQDKAENE